MYLDVLFDNFPKDNLNFFIVITGKLGNNPWPKMPKVC